MRRFTVAAVATAVAASLIAPQAILAEQPPPQPASPGSAATPPPAAGENGDGAPLGSDGPIVTDGSEAQPSTHPTLRTSLARHAPQTAAASAGPAATVVIKDFLFSPKTVTINVGESVKWDNKGKAEEGHTATGDNFDSGVLKEGETYTHKFSKAGTFDYICTLHSNMKGTVVVRAGSGGGGSGNGGGSGGGGSQNGGGSQHGGGSANSSSAGSGGTTSGGGSGSSFFPDSSGSGSSGGSLPSTGLDLGLLALLGVDLLLAGTLALLRSRSPGPG